MSPIASLRKANYNSTLGSVGSETVDMSKFPPSFRITRNYGTTNNRTNLRYRHRGNYKWFYIFYIQIRVFRKHIPTTKNAECIEERSFGVKSIHSRNQRCEYN